MRPQLAPADSSAVVGAHSRERGHARLQERPFNREGADPRFEHDGRLASPGLPGTVEVELPSADVDQPSRRGVRRGVARRLPGHAGRQGQDEGQDGVSSRVQRAHGAALFEVGA